MKLVGFAGSIGAGKDTAVNYLVTLHKNNIHVKFANGLRDVVAVLAGFYKDDKSHRLYFDDRKWKDTYPLMVINNVVYTPRQLLQKVGTECMRNGLHKDIWCSVLDAEIANYPHANYVFVSDVRFDNEAKWLREHNGTLIYIDVPIDPTDERLNHESEAYQALLAHQANLVISNDISAGIGQYWSKLERLYDVLESTDTSHAERMLIN